ncbi:MAG: hypothetical protein H6819_01790 [Phycisphaerales bacterium]|nr:hypothetical protein [Phycisphaerales bacterium]MCB9857058.1 hypothetical protein [Phycisphaerales bacterium]MCB9861815.1 hypothetical protein [Phycisphaerales bacterium]
MSSIPPNAIGSVLQSGVAQQAASQQKDRVENEQTDASRELTGRGGTEDILEIEETDGGTKVDADGGGYGSQGRYDGAPEEAADDSMLAEDAPAITHDEDGRPHLDVSA